MFLDEEDTEVVEICPTGTEIGCLCTWCVTHRERRALRGQQVGPVPSEDFLARLRQLGDRRLREMT